VNAEDLSDGPDEDLPGCDIALTRVDGRYRRCTVEMDGHLLGALRRRGPGIGTGINVEAGAHSLRVVSGRCASAAMTLELLPGQAVTVTIGRSPDGHELWTLSAEPVT